MALGMLEKIDFARLATLIDGEGSIGINGWVQKIEEDKKEGRELPSP